MHREPRVFGKSLPAQTYLILAMRPFACLTLIHCERSFGLSAVRPEMRARRVLPSATGGRSATEVKN
jgi:hypothetical protein